MTTAILGAEDGDRGAVFARLAAQLGIDAATVPNLDALWDVLRTDIPGPFSIVWRDHGHARARLGPDFDRIVALLDELAAERDDFTYVLA
jgi:ribonuclease inhibitor